MCDDQRSPFYKPVLIGEDRRPIYMATFDENYSGAAPETLYVKMQSDVWMHEVQNYAKTHGCSVFVYGTYREPGGAVPLGYYKHTDKVSRINGEWCYFLVLWNAYIAS